MRRALACAADAVFTSPNPKVGAVVVRDGVVVAEGSHQGAGTPHAEAVALEASDATGATLFVNLEPCMHHGNTPPCAPAIVQAGITRVVVAIEDPDPRVSGSGVAYLREHGLEVDVGVLADEATALNDAYIHQRLTGRPLMTLKLALSLDGKVAARDGSSRWVTGAESRRDVHDRRAAADGVMVGAGTVVADDPQLTARDVMALRQPVRVVVDATGKVPAASRIFDGGDAILMTTISCPHAIKTQWKEAGAEVVEVPHGPDGGVDLRAVVANLAGRGWLEVYCEGGAAVATSLLRDDLVDRLDLYYAPILIGGDGVGLGDLGVDTIGAAHRWTTLRSTRLGPDTLLTLVRAER
jgi:diaminohydroxyphosphoribosylaminopyrimidine deaminase/5-amino-6-(5-phosphoribosylamino)uracil reductase